MSDEFEGAENKNLSPHERAFFNTVHQRKVITDALKSRNLCCLPGQDGYADTAPVKNLLRNHTYEGANLLYLKEHQRANGFTTGEYATKEQIDIAREDIPGLFPQKGQKSISLFISERKEGELDVNGKQIYEDKQIVLFNIGQLNKPLKFKEWAEQQLQERREENLQKNFGDYKAPELEKKGPGPEITCTSTDPEKYLGQYLAAVSLGGKFKATPEQGDEFSTKCINAMYEKTIIAKTGEKQGELIPDPFKLNRISNEANKYCKEFKNELKAESRKAEQEQKQEQKQEHKRGRGRKL